MQTSESDLVTMSRATTAKGPTEYYYCRTGDKVTSVTYYPSTNECTSDTTHFTPNGPSVIPSPDPRKVYIELMTQWHKQFPVTKCEQGGKITYQQGNIIASSPSRGRNPEYARLESLYAQQMRRD